MTYYDFVNRPLNLKRRILHKIEDVRLKESACMNTTAPIQERVQVSPSNATEQGYIRYIDAKNELYSMMDKLADAQDEVRSFLYKNLSVDSADILEWRYVDGKEVLEIADICGLTEQSVRNKISKANRAARKRWSESEYKML